MMFAYVFITNCGYLDFSIGSFYNELTLANLYHVVDTCDDHELCSWEQNDSSRVQEVRFCCGAAALT